MNCPNCVNVSLVMSDRQGVEIDYCPTCRGIWLDRGELDKIIDRIVAETESQANSKPNVGHTPPPTQQSFVGQPFMNPYEAAKYHKHHHKKHNHWLKNLFD